ncbi:VOC family protein [Methyloversatilis sp.]|uniref:VOC family protein n=1 Tax=Methyloversatilis sp. TaxID=2569862 RepID=UPI0027347457|nr:VOC family protein [Methyloversatilis sp.]MDP3577772.1 VOC family protein [Methyloversatilis sp.]
MSAALDHLVVIASSLDEGVAWCEATLGVTPGPGGQHAFMGTHNRLFSIASPTYPLAYFEIIAMDPAGPPPARRRWFDMDDPGLQDRLRRNGPQLTHWVSRVPDAHAAVAALQALGIERGEVIAASRPTPQGLLQWQITLRADGQRLFDGALPTLIQWGAVHPAASMPASGVTLSSLTLQHPQADTLAAACRALDLPGVAVQTGPAQLRARLQTPKGIVEICS